MKHVAPAILAVLVGSMSVMAVSQTADASPYHWHRYHHHDRGHDYGYWRARRAREARYERWSERRWRERHWREERAESWRRHHRGW